MSQFEKYNLTLTRDEAKAAAHIIIQAARGSRPELPLNSSLLRKAEGLQNQMLAEVDN